MFIGTDDGGDMSPGNVSEDAVLLRLLGALK